MIDKIASSIEEAIAPIVDNSIIMVGGFGEAGIPYELLGALAKKPVKNLTIISNNAGTFDHGIAALLLNKQVKKIICSHPRPPHAEAFANAYQAGEVELEVVPQGTLAERIRAAGAGLGPFYTPTGANTLLAEGKESIHYDGRDMIMELPLHADFALIKAKQADRWGNLMYGGAARNFNPLMAMAAKYSIVQTDEVVPLGDLKPEYVMTAGIFVDSVICIGA